MRPAKVTTLSPKPMTNIQINLTIITLLALSGCAHHDEWTTTDTWMQVGVTATLIADAYTTNNIQYKANLKEGGLVAAQFLGEQPSTSGTITYFTTLAISNYLISKSLPKGWRRFWQTSQIGIHGYAAYQNCSVDLC